MDAARHLQDFIRAQVQTREDVAASLDDVGVPRVVDHHRVQAADIQRRLTRGGHGEEERPSHLAVEKRPDDADRLAAVVERGGQALPPVTQLLGDLLDLSPRATEFRSDPQENLVYVSQFLGPMCGVAGVSQLV